LTLEAPSPAALDGSGVASETPFDPSEIEGADPKVADLAAHRLLEVISSREPRNEAARAAQLNYLLEKLRPEIIQRAASSPAASSRDLVCAERLVDALATWVISSGVPFPRASEVIQPLLGLGPPSLRDAVKRALKALVREELKDARRRNPEAPGADGGSATYGALAGKLLDTSMTSEAFIRDACSVLWETDGKSLLGSLVHVLLLQSTAPAGSPGARVAQLCLEDLEARTAISFSSVDAWQKWWTEVKDLSVDRILADAQARTREEYVVNWRQMLRRLRETGDRERLFLALQDTLDSANSIELRVAAVGALGDYADWVEDMRPTVNGEPIGAEDPREKLLARGVVRLAALFQGNGALGERREVYRAALTSLRQYHAFLEHNPRLLESVSQIVSDQIQQLAREPQTQDGTDTLEVIRLAGALRVASARVFVEGILAEDRPGDDGLELLAAAANCLARLLEKGVNAEAAALLMSQFKKTRLGPEKAVRELRRACVNALGVGSPSPEVRAELRAFLREVLLGSSPIPVAGSPLRGDKDLRIPAILGLGTLARQKDAEGFRRSGGGPRAPVPVRAAGGRRGSGLPGVRRGRAGAVRAARHAGRRARRAREDGRRAPLEKSFEPCGGRRGRNVRLGAREPRGARARGRLPSRPRKSADPRSRSPDGAAAIGRKARGIERCPAREPRPGENGRGARRRRPREGRCRPPRRLQG
jgi:hypothetical protein